MRNPSVPPTSSKPLREVRSVAPRPLPVFVLVDVSGSEQYTLPLLKEAGGRFVDSVIRFGKDTAAVLKFEGETTIMQDLSSNPARMICLPS